MEQVAMAIFILTGWSRVPASCTLIFSFLKAFSQVIQGIRIVQLVHMSL